MEETIKEGSYNEKNIELLEELNNLLQECINNNSNAIKIKRIYDYTNTSYPEIQSDLEKRFPKSYNIGTFKNHIDILNEILNSILTKNIESEFFLDLEQYRVKMAFNFINTIFNYINNRNTLTDIKNQLFLIAHEIDPKNFKNLTQSSVIALCEMSEKGVDVSEYASSGNLKISLLNDVANGKLKDKEDEMAKKYIIISTIEEILNGNYMQELEYSENFSLIFEKNDDNGVSIFSSYDIENPIAIVNTTGDFIKGSINIILTNIYNNIKHKKVVAKDTNTIDNIISTCNDLTRKEIFNQSNLASALHLALEEFNKSNNSSSET